ncbi:MAG: transposase [Sphingobacteriales bacterium]
MITIVLIVTKKYITFRLIQKHIIKTGSKPCCYAISGRLSSITDKVIPAMNEWRQRPLESVYAFVYLDCMHYKARG